MRISTFKTKDREDIIGFKNYDRIPEDDIVEEVLLRLERNENATIPEKPLQLPYGYVFECHYKEEPVLVICDDCYGAMMQADDTTILQELCDYLEA